MTIGISTSRVSFACDGATKIFPVPIQAYLAADFTVILTAPVSAGGGETTLVLNSDYSLVTSGTLQPTAWTLTTLAASAYATGYTLQVIANPVQTQQTQYVQGQAFPSAAVQANVDRLTQMVQRLQDQVSRCVRVPDGDVAPAMLLPTATVRANLASVFDASGNVGVGVIPVATLTQGIFNTFLGLSPPYLQTSAEITAGVTPVNFAYPPLYVDRYGTNTTPGTTSMVPAITAAITVAKQMGGGTVIFQDGADYFCGNYTTGVHVFPVVSAVNLTLKGRARIITNTTAISIPIVFYFTDPNQVTIEGLRFYDTGANISLDYQGPWPLHFTTTTANDCGGISLRDIEATNVLGPFAFSLAGGGTGRVRGITLDGVKADTCYYGLSFQEQGDGVSGNAIINNCKRAYYPYGVTGHNLTLDIWHDAVALGANSCVVIKRYTRDTSGIKARLSFHGYPGLWGQLVNFEIQTTAGTAGITALGAITAGSLYVTNWYANVPLTGGSGTGATATIETAGGAVVGVWICNRGSGYLVGDSLSATQANLGGAGSGFAVAVSAVGGTIFGCDIDLDVSGASFPDSLIISNTPFPFQFRAYTPPGVLLTTTTDAWDEITFRGNLGDWSFGQPGQTPQAINIVSTQTGAPGRLHLGGDLFHNFGGDSQVYPGFVIRTAVDTDVYTKLGDITAAPVFIDLQKYDGHGFALRIVIHAQLNNRFGGDATNNEYVLTGRKAGAGVPTLSTTTAGFSSTAGTATVPAFAASGTGINVSFTNYNNALSYLKMSVQHLGRFGT